MSRRLTRRLLSCLLAVCIILPVAPALAEPEVYFSPNGGIRDRLLRAINHTKATIDVAIFDFTSGELAGALVAAKGRGVAVRVVATQRATVLFVIGSELARLARQISSEVPILFITPGDPVAANLVASLAHPGGNMTAMTFEYPELSGKRLQLLQEIAPRIRRVLVLYDPRDASPRQGIAAAREAAPKLGITLVERETRSREEVTHALEALEGVHALLAIPGGLTSGHYEEIIRAATAKRIPTIFHARTASTMEALASYGANDVDIARQAARLVDKILKGAKAGGLPVERPTKISLVINLKTAKALGLTIPQSVLIRADHVIE